MPHTHFSTQTQARQMWAATHGLWLFIMKGIHRSVLALPLSRQFFHTGRTSLPLTPSHFPFSFSIQFGAKGEAGEKRNRSICRTAWRAAWGRACHFYFHPSRLLAGAYAAERALYLGLKEGRSAAGLSASLAARQSAQRAQACLSDDGTGHAHTTQLLAHPPRSTVILRQDGWSNTSNQHWLCVHMLTIFKYSFIFFL